jgi:hypothetical protein
MFKTRLNSMMLAVVIAAFCGYPIGKYFEWRAAAEARAAARIAERARESFESQQFLKELQATRDRQERSLAEHQQQSDAFVRKVQRDMRRLEVVEYY